MRQAVSLGRVAHAYLFCGPRGTGKTSTARILAKAVNCLSLQGGEPDNECELCRAINEGHALDLIEIDAASNRGIDDIRNLSDKIHYTPNEARYKVYIIDEVHMLTEPAFNALLKTLEEPPGHAIFILATTEAHKVPLTIISRCQRFDFRRIPLDRMVDKLTDLCAGEGIEASPEALGLIARTSSGGLRDAENLLEQVSVSYGSPVTEENVRDMLGLGGDEAALELVGHITGKNVKEGLKLINQVSGEGNDLGQLHRGVVEYLRAVLLLKANAGTPLGYPDEVVDRLKSLSDAESMSRIVHALKTFARADLKRDSSSPLALELALVESSADIPVQTAPQRPPAALSRQDPATPPAPPRSQTTASGPPTPTRGTSPPQAPVRMENPRPVFQPAPVSVPASGPAAQLETQWREMSRALRHVGRKFKLGALLNVCKEREVVDGVVILKFSHQSNMERMQQELDNPESRRAFMEALTKVMDSEYDVKISLVDGGNGAANQNAAQKSHLVRAAQAMGARVVGEKEEESHDE